MPYHTNHATFVLPRQLKDKTVHIFTSNENGPSEFSVVISHANVQPDETLSDFAQRLVQEMEKGLATFALARSVERSIDDAAAIELHYSWRNDGSFLHQRQLITLVPGATPGSRQAMMVGATCMRAFTDEWNAAFDGMLAGMALRHAGAAAPALSDLPAAFASDTVFALSERRRTLHAFVDHDEACRKTDAREVEQDAWAFFAADGAPLHTNFVVPDSATARRTAGTCKAGTYILEARAGDSAPSLLERLGQASMLVTSSSALPFSNLAEVQTFLKLSGRN